MKIKTYIKIGSVLALMSASIVNSFSQVPLVFDVENRTPTGTCNTTAGNTNTSISSLPDPFTFTTGGRVATFDDWTCRRNQIKSDIENYEIGPKPPKPGTVTATYSGGKLNITSTVGGQTLTQSVTVTIPSGTGPFPVVIGMNAGTGQLTSSLFSGCIQINYAHDQVVSYGGGSGSINSGDPYFKLYPSTNIGKYSAWSWGISRIIDGLELTKSSINADLKRIAVTGCSYAGKMALFGGAFDERIALTIAQESGGGGINSWRMSQAYTTRTGVNIEKIDNTNYSWFKSSLKNQNPNNLPHDHHELIAMIAPRALLVLGNPTQEWLGDESGYKTCVAANEVWKSMGVEDRFGWVFTPDHSHCSASSDQNTAVTAFVNKFMKGVTSTNTNIRTNPTKATQQNLTINSSVYNWTTPTITFAPADPNVPSVTISSPSSSATFEAPATVNFTAIVTDADNNVSKVEFFNGTTKLGEDLTAPYTYTWNNVASGTYSITAVATDATAKKGTSAAFSLVVKEAPMKIYKITDPITIDGELEAVWGNGNVMPMNATKLLTGTVTNASDLSGYGKMLWDNTYLYLLAVVTDDAKRNDSQNSYDDDQVEFYIDVDNAKSSTYDANDYQFSFGWNDGTIVGVIPSTASVTGITYVAISTTTGYIIEARIPWSTINATPTAGKLLGVDFMINDDDDGAGRDGKLSWNAATDDAYKDASLFGTGKLMAEQLVTSLDNSQLLKLSVYPNPVKDFVNVEGIEGSFSYEILNVNGALIQKGNSEGRIEIQTIQKGIYFMSLMQNEKSSMIKLIVE